MRLIPRCRSTDLLSGSSETVDRKPPVPFNSENVGATDGQCLHDLLGRPFPAYPKLRSSSLELVLTHHQTPHDLVERLLRRAQVGLIQQRKRPIDQLFRIGQRRARFFVVEQAGREDLLAH